MALVYAFAGILWIMIAGYNAYIGADYHHEMIISTLFLIAGEIGRNTDKKE